MSNHICDLSNLKQIILQLPIGLPCLQDGIQNHFINNTFGGNFDEQGIDTATQKSPVNADKSNRM
jgi:hypothetical protein